MKIIFLDFDGVLNSQANNYRGIEQDKVALLNTIVGRTGASLVITSSWRKGTSLQDLRALLKAKGFTGSVIGKTSWLRAGSRGREIQVWLDKSKRNIERFVILDDENDMGRMAGHLVQTDTRYGLQGIDAEVAINCLSYPPADYDDGREVLGYMNGMAILP